MAQYRTLEALVELGGLRQYLDTVKDHERTAEMFEEFEKLIDVGEEHDSFAPESTGVFERPRPDTDASDEDDSPTIPVGVHMAADLVADPALMDVDKYASRRGANHWTRRRPSQGPTRKLSDLDAQTIRLDYEGGVRAVELAKAYGVTTSTVYGVLRGKTHRRASAGWVEPVKVAIP